MERLMYVYQCRGYGDRLLYVGITKDVKRRLNEHAQDKHWWPEVAKITQRAFRREIEARWAEWALIVTHHPPYNSSSAVPKTPDAIAAEPTVVHEVIYETFPQYLRRIAVRVRRRWQRLPTGYAFGFGLNLAIISTMTWVHYTFQVG